MTTIILAQAKSTNSSTNSVMKCNNRQQCMALQNPKYCLAFFPFHVGHLCKKVETPENIC